MICLLFTSDDVIPGKHNQENTTKQSIECGVLTTDRAKTGVTINVETGY